MHTTKTPLALFLAAIMFVGMWVPTLTAPQAQAAVPTYSNLA